MTETIASIAGPYLVVTGLGFIFSRSFYERMVLGSGGADPILLNLSGAAHFVVGMTILVNHFMWGGIGQIAVTLLGMAAVAKGAMLIAVPETTLKSPKTVGKTLTASAAGFLIAGTYLCYVGYWPAG